MNILIIEKDFISRKKIQNRLQCDHDCFVKPTDCTYEGMLLTRDSDYDAIVLGASLSKEDCIAITHSIHRDKENPNYKTPILFFERGDKKIKKQFALNRKVFFLYKGNAIDDLFSSIIIMAKYFNQVHINCESTAIAA